MNELQRHLAMAPRGGLADMARYLDVTPTAVSSWKAGKTTPDEPERLELIEEYLDLPKGYFTKWLTARQVPPDDERHDPSWPLPGVLSAMARAKHPSRMAATTQSDDVGEVAELRRVLRVVGQLVEQLTQDAVDGGREEYAELLGELRGVRRAVE